MNLEERPETRQSWKTRYDPIVKWVCGFCVLLGFTLLDAQNLYHYARDGQIYGRKGQVYTLQDDTVYFIFKMLWSLLVSAFGAYVLVSLVLLGLRRVTMRLLGRR